MGYISEVGLVVAVRTAEQADELMAIYAMHPLVQQDDLVKRWKRHDRPEGIFFTYHNDCIKWYPEYDIVQGMEHLITLATQFYDERGPEKFPYAVSNLRIGEEYKDVECTENGSDADLESAVYDRAFITRRIRLDF